MIPLAEARAHVLDAVGARPPVARGRDTARGLVLAADVVATESVPPFDNTAMDGYAVRAADTAGASDEQPCSLRVVDDLPAGRAPTIAVGSGEAIRIMTGAPMPDGADAIVPVEVTDAHGDLVRIRRVAAPGDHVRAAGGDLGPGEVVFRAGTELRAAHLGVLASLDVGEVEVFPRPRVAVLSTGDELVASGPLARGQIRDSNRPALLAALAEADCEAVDLGIAADDEREIEDRIGWAVESCDALLTSGGVSMGEYDYVKAVLERLAAEHGGGFRWMQVAIKPAKPFAFGTIGAVPVFGLAGNPVSSLVGFELFARPALRRMAGHARTDRPVVAAVAAEAMPRRPDGKLHLERVTVTYDGRFGVRRSGVQASNVLSGTAAADGLALVPDGEGPDAGDPVDVLLLRPVGGDLPVGP